MKPIVKQVKEVIEAAEPDVTVVPVRSGESFVCPIGIALWQEYRRRNPDGFKVPPTDGLGIKDGELQLYLTHIHTCDDCNEV